MTSKFFDITEGASPQTQIGDALSSLAQTIAERRGADEGSYTFRLLQKGSEAIGKKLVEEAFETALAAKELDYARDAVEAADDATTTAGAAVEDAARSAADAVADTASSAVASVAAHDHLRYEAGDVLYHLLVLMEHEGITLDELAAELNARMDDEALAKRSGIAVLLPEHVNRGK